MITLNAYDTSSKIYQYTGKVAQQRDVITGNPVPLRYATDKPLLKDKAGYVQGFIGGEWKYYIDNRGKEYWDADGSKHTITELGLEVPEGALLEAPVIPPTLKDQLALVDSECKRRILSEWSLEHQSNVNLGVNGYTDADKANCIGWINSCLEAKAALIADETKLITIDVRDDSNWPTYSA